MSMPSLTSLRASTVSHAFRVATLLTLAVAAAGCTRSDTADAKGREVAAKPVATAAVLKNSVRPKGGRLAVPARTCEQPTTGLDGAPSSLVSSTMSSTHGVARTSSPLPM